MNLFEIIKRQARETGIVSLAGGEFNELAEDDQKFWSSGWVVFVDCTPIFWVCNPHVAQSVQENCTDWETWPAKDIVAGFLPPLPGR